MAKKKTHEEFVKEVYELRGTEYEVIGKYVRAKDEIAIKHNKCGHTHDYIASNFLNGAKCPVCSKCVRKDTEYFKKEVDELFEGEYKVASEYKGAYEEIKVLHNHCGETFITKPSLLLNNSKCPYCYKGQKITQEVYERIIEKKYNGEYSVIGKYTGKDNYIKVKHNKCGNEYDVVAKNFKENAHCPKCNNRERKTTEGFVKELFELVGEEFKLNGEYRGRAKEVKLTHSVCGYDFEVKPEHFIKNPTCPFCTNRRLKVGFNDLATTHPLISTQWDYDNNDGLTPRDVTASYSKKKIKWRCKNGHTWENKISNEIKRANGIDEVNCKFCDKKEASFSFNLKTEFPELAKQWNYNKNKNLKPEDFLPASGQKVWWVCNEGHEWITSIRHRTERGTNCPYCSGYYALEGYNDLATLNPELAKEWHPTKNGDLKPSMVTKNANKKVWWKCSNKDCGHEWKALVNSRNRKVEATGCPKCNQSKGEKQISIYLEKKHIKFKAQYRTKKCKNSNTLPFDFAILSKKEDLICLIEFDGQQHFYPNAMFGGEESFKKTKQNDEIKTNYCINNNIPLIRIPYWLRDYVDVVLDHFLIPLLEEE